MTDKIEPIEHYYVDDILDDDGYPTEEFLESIRQWPFQYDYKYLFDYVKSGWWMPSWGWHSEEVDDEFGKSIIRYNISTGGWSGNEEIIGALESNTMFWVMCWQESRRGGHFVFEVTKK
jgi:hypothetical protein